jgi:hypothetical protein
MDVQMTDINSPAASTSSTPCPTPQPLRPTPWSLPPVPPRLMSTDPLFIGHTFRFKTAKFQVVEKEATKKNASWIWAEGAQVLHLGVPKKKRADWLCLHCWNKGTTWITNASSTTSAIDHLRNTHHLNSDGLIPREDPGVIVMQREGATQPEMPQSNVFNTVTQAQLDRFKAALVLWIVMAHMALSSVENEAFRGLIELLNPHIHEYLYKSGDSVRRLVMDSFIKVNWIR